MPNGCGFQLRSSKWALFFVELYKLAYRFSKWDWLGIYASRKWYCPAFFNLLLSHMPVEYGGGDSITMLEWHPSQIQFGGSDRLYTIHFLRTIKTTMHFGFLGNSRREKNFLTICQEFRHNNYEIYFRNYHDKVQSQVKHGAASYITIFTGHKIIVFSFRFEVSLCTWKK